MSRKIKRFAKKRKIIFDAPLAISLSAILLLLLAIGVIVNSHISQSENNKSEAYSNCDPNAILINPCRPWFGAAVGGNPQAASDNISQFTYLESQIGRQIDIFHDYHPAGNLPLNSAEIHFAQRPNTYIYVNWKPASNWADAGGGNATVNAHIDQAAANIKAITPIKIFLTIWHEPENDVSAFDNSTEQTACQSNTYFQGLKGAAGTPAQYQAMWQNVHNRFAADGVTNVVWVMNYMNYKPWQCLVPYLWPGNNLVDWVTYESYPYGSTTAQNKISDMYNLLQADEDATHDFESKPWGIAEFEDCKDADQTVVYQKYQQFKQALDANMFPRLKMYMAYADTGNNAGTGCLSNYSVAGAYDSTEQTYFNQFANDPIFTVMPPPLQSTNILSPTAVPTDTPRPRPTATPTLLHNNGKHLRKSSH